MTFEGCKATPSCSFIQFTATASEGLNSHQDRVRARDGDLTNIQKVRIGLITERGTTITQNLGNSR
jgi:hypothetical protein